MSSLVHGNDDLDILVRFLFIEGRESFCCPYQIRTTLMYLDAARCVQFISSICSVHMKFICDIFFLTSFFFLFPSSCFVRGEPQSLTIAMQSFDTFPLVDRIRCILIFLKSNVTFGPAWRALSDETLTLLGREHQPKEDRNVGKTIQNLPKFAKICQNLSKFAKIWHK